MAGNIGENRNGLRSASAFLWGLLTILWGLLSDLCGLLTDLWGLPASMWGLPVACGDFFAAIERLLWAKSAV